MTHFPINFEPEIFENQDIQSPEFHKIITDKIISGFYQKIALQKELLKSFRPDIAQDHKVDGILREVVRNMMIRKIDKLWQEHLLHIDHLRSDIQMRTVGQKDPLLEFKHDSFSLFETFYNRLREEIIHDLFRFEMLPQPPQRPSIPIEGKLPFGAPSAKMLS